MSNSDAEDQEVWGWEVLFQEVSATLRSIMRQYGTANEGYAHFAVERLGICVQAVSGVRQHLQASEANLSDADRAVVVRYVQDLEELASSVRELVGYWETYLDQIDRQSESTAFRAQVVHMPGRRGRPSFDISRHQLEYLSSLSFTWTHIAALLGVSRMTVYRRRAEFGMLDDDSREYLTGIEVRRHVTQMRQQFPNMGESMVIGRLHAMGFRVTRESVRQAIRETDPLNTALRWPGGLTSRRPYSVPGPNSLWHIGKLSIPYMHSTMNVFYTQMAITNSFVGASLLTAGSTVTVVW